ncbi:C13 family peptidase [Rhodoferax saidenbachensis]|uniref:Peptidase C13 family protein n=1 Tax=Rhodoferax saidenbachensis TaxID=1484693 RepID=A0ABU1ZHX8_9BURK|nr:C13 family peptidase [Rhodoferax saidenbachensis]MDR7305151.1 hypothetical protein [Rhodoferax saidenbachensis]
MNPNPDMAEPPQAPDTEPTTLVPLEFRATEPVPVVNASPTGWHWLIQGLRAAALCPVRGLPAGPTPWQMLLIAGLTTALTTGAGWLEIVGPADFLVRNWLFSWASTALLIFAVWLALNWGRTQAAHATPVAVWLLLYWVATTPISVAAVALAAVAGRDWLPNWWLESAWWGWVVFGLFWLWIALAALRITGAVNRSRWVCAAVVLTVLALQGLDTWALQVRPWQPTYVENDAAEPVTLQLSQEVFEAQQDLLDDALGGLRPSTPGPIQVFGLVYAPYAQDVFLRESTMVKGVLEQRFGAEGRVLQLVNHATTATDIPWATNRNLERSLAALAQAMDKERDVLVVYLTSHGGADFRLAAQHWPLEVKDLTAAQLRETLDRLGIRNRVVAVSACYSGGWIEPLRGDTTLVMTAADKDHTSYGCGSKSELTFFGRAVFDEQLRKTLSFEEAFKAAVPVIQQREIEGRKSDGFSNPQIAVGEGIRKVLQAWAAEQALGAPKP